jgi:hypothetical protein
MSTTVSPLSNHILYDAYFDVFGMQKGRHGSETRSCVRCHIISFLGPKFNESTDNFLFASGTAHAVHTHTDDLNAGNQEAKNTHPYKHIRGVPRHTCTVISF